MNNRIDPEELALEEQRLILAATARIEQAMKAAGLMQADVAERTGTSAAHVSQVLNGTRNMTLRTIAMFGLACDVRWTFATVVKASAVKCYEPLLRAKPFTQGPQRGVLATLSLIAA